LSEPFLSLKATLTLPILLLLINDFEIVSFIV